jgi:hypothetical protein
LADKETGTEAGKKAGRLQGRRRHVRRTGRQVRRQGSIYCRAKDKEKDSRTERHQYDTAQNKKRRDWGTRRWENAE